MLDKNVKLLRALCICNKEAVVKNQTSISHLIFDNEKRREKLVFEL